MPIDSEKYLSFTTYKKDGTPKALPIWICKLNDGKLGFTTSSSSWKARRLANDPRIKLQPCDQRGRLRDGGVEVSGTAEVVTGARFDEVKAGIKSKYGFGYYLISAINRLAGLVGKSQVSDVAIVITLDADA